MRVWKDVMSVHTFIPSYGLQRSWHSCPRRVNASNKNTSSMHHPQRRNVTASMVGLKKKNGHIRKNLTPHDGPQRYSWGTQKKKKTGEWVWRTKLTNLFLQTLGPSNATESAAGVARGVAWNRDGGVSASLSPISFASVDIAEQRTSGPRSPSLAWQHPVKIRNQQN